MLRGGALNWEQAVLRSDVNVIFSEFLPKFKGVFDKGVSLDMEAQKLVSLKQGKRSVAAFLVDFCILAGETGWEEEAL